MISDQMLQTNLIKSKKFNNPHLTSQYHYQHRLLTYGTVIVHDTDSYITIPVKNNKSQSQNT